MSSHSAATELTFLGKLVLEGEIHCQTGLHIGAGKGSLEIGGADNPVVKDAFGVPYIPGSSLRGRLRCLLARDFIFEWFWTCSARKIGLCWREWPKGYACSKTMRWAVGVAEVAGA